MIINSFRFLDKDEVFSNPSYLNWSRCSEWGYVESELSKLSGKTVHNTCCGCKPIHLNFAKKISQTNNRIYNSDIKDSIIKELGDFSIYNITVPSDVKYDVVLCISALEHLKRKNRVKAFNALYDSVKPGGRLIITCDYPDVEIEMLEGLLNEKCKRSSDPLNGNNSTTVQPECGGLNVVLIDITKPN